MADSMRERSALIVRVALLLVAACGPAVYAAPTSSAPDGVSSPQGQDRGLVTQPNTPPGGTPMGGLQSSSATIIPAQPALTPLQQLQAAVNSPTVTTEDLMNASMRYRAAVGFDSRAPVITPTGDTSYRDANNAMQQQVNQALPFSEIQSVVNAMHAASAMSPGPDRQAAQALAQQLSYAETQWDADYAIYQEAVTAAQLKATGHPGAALAILWEANPAALVPTLKAAYEASQAAFDDMWSNMNSKYGISRTDMLDPNLPGNLSSDMSSATPADSAAIKAAVSQASAAIEAMTGNQAAASFGTITTAQPATAEISSAVAQYNAAALAITADLAQRARIMQDIMGGNPALKSGAASADNAATQSASPARVAADVSAYAAAAQAVLDDLAASDRALQAAIAGRGATPSESSAAASAALDQNRAAAQAITNDLAAQEQAVMQATNGMQLVAGPSAAASSLEPTPVNVMALSAQLRQLQDAALQTDPQILQTAKVASIYNGYRLIPGQNGSSVIVVPSLQVAVPSAIMTAPGSQILVPTNQVLTPSSLMTSLDLQPALCGR